MFFSLLVSRNNTVPRLLFVAVVSLLLLCGSYSSAWTSPKRFARAKLKAATALQLAKKKRDQDEETVVALLHSHHLLDHKPDNLILKGGKYKLRGAACLGRPGVALCIGPPKAHAKFKSALESAMPQKRFKSTPLKINEAVQSMDGFSQTESLGEFRQVLASIDQESEFFALTGIQEENSANNISNNLQAKEESKKTGKRKQK